MPLAFLSLPGEIRNRIYTFALTTTSPIIDPNNCSSAAAKPPPPLPHTPHHSIPPLGVALLRTSRLIHAEAPVRMLYARNTFCFTTVTHSRRFLNSLPPFLRASVRALAIDVRDVDPAAAPAPAPSSPVNREWARYLAWTTATAADCCVGSLRCDAPGLRVLELHFDAWPRVRVTRRHLWDILRRLLCNVEGLERVVLRGSYAAGAAMERREPWDPVFYVGTDELSTDDVVEQMWRCVEAAEGEDGMGGGKLIRWERRAEGSIALEIAALAHLSRASVELVFRQKPSDPWPASGACTYEEYCRRKDPLWFASSSRRLNPSAFV